MRKDFEEIILKDEIDIEGQCINNQREALLEEAVKTLQENPQEWAKKEYYGIKNYAGFGDQREDHSYGMGPRHGHIVFSIGRGPHYNPERKELYIEFLLFFRDFRNKEINSDRDWPLDLKKIILRKNRLEQELQDISGVLKENERR